MEHYNGPIGVYDFATRLLNVGIGIGILALVVAAICTYVSFHARPERKLQALASAKYSSREPRLEDFGVDKGLMDLEKYANGEEIEDHANGEPID